MPTVASPLPNPNPYNEYNTRIASPSRISQIDNRFLRTLAHVGDIAGTALAPQITAMIPGTTLNERVQERRAYNRGTALEKENEATLTDREKQQQIQKAEDEALTDTPEKRQAYVAQHPDLFSDLTPHEKNDYALTGKFPQREPTETDKKIDEYTNEQGQRVLTFQRADGSTYDQVGGKVYEKPQTFSNAFEAFAYGTPEQKKSAQDFLDYEKKIGARYRTPTEFDEKFRLFKEDPETYKAMFGDKSAGGPDKATATKMLTYFDKRRREIQNDFTLDDQQKAQQLQDIEGLEKPFMDAVQPGAGQGASGGSANAEDKHRVRVIAPDGTEGTVPLRQLKDAKRKGYRVAP
jgi:hypothetical protein